MADQKLTALSELSVPALDDLAYLVDDVAGTPTSVKITLTRLLGMAAIAPGGRLTTESGVPISTSDWTGRGTLYYTPHAHGGVRLYDGTRWRLYTFTERSLSLTLTADKNYDVFLYDNAGTLTLELSAAWTNDTTRADALTTQDGVTVKSGATTRLWLGTIRASGSNVTEDSLTKRYVWNAYNRVDRHMRRASASSHSYSGTSWRYWDNSSANRLAFVLGEPSAVGATLRDYVTTGAYAQVGIGVDSDTATPDTWSWEPASAEHGLSCSVYGQFSAGHRFLAALERSPAGGGCQFTDLILTGKLSC